MPRLTRENIKTIRRTREITIPDTDITVTIRELSKAESLAFRDKAKQAGEDDKAQMALADELFALAVVDEAGKPYLTAADLEPLGPAVVAFVARAIFDHTGTIEEKKSDVKS